MCCYLCIFWVFFPDHDKALTKASDEQSADKSSVIHSVPLAKGTSELTVCWPWAGTELRELELERQTLTPADRHTEKETEGQDECGSCQRRR